MTFQYGARRIRGLLPADPLPAALGLAVRAGNVIPARETEFAADSVLYQSAEVRLRHGVPAAPGTVFGELFVARVHRHLLGRTALEAVPDKTDVAFALKQ